MPTIILISETTSKPLWPGILWVILFLIAFVGLGIYSYIRPRTNARRIASSRGWSYVKRDDTTLDRFVTWPFYLGRKHRANNIVTGVFEGRNVTLFDFDFQNSQGGFAIGIGPIAVPLGGQPKRADTGIFGGYDTGLGVVTGKSRSRLMDRGDGKRKDWGICAMEMPGTLSQVLIHVAFSVDGTFELFSDAIGVTNGNDPAVADLSLGDPTFDKKFVVRAEDPKIAAALLPKATRDLLVANRNRMVHHSLHIWTWNRYLFTLGTMPLTEKMVDFRLPLMAKMIENVGK